MRKTYAVAVDITFRLNLPWDKVETVSEKTEQIYQKAFIDFISEVFEENETIKRSIGQNSFGNWFRANFNEGACVIDYYFYCVTGSEANAEAIARNSAQDAARCIEEFGAHCVSIQTKSLKGGTING